jgi:outer membrane protein assembly factor BamB
MCCLELTGIPLMMSVQGYAMRNGYSINGFIIRKERKPAGRQRQIEGVLNDYPIVFLDDILNSGDSIQRAIVALSMHKRNISLVVALVDFGTSPIGERLLQQGIHLKSLMKLEELGITKGTKPPQQSIPTQIFREIWTFNPEVEKSFDIVPKSTPVLDDERLYFGADDGRFYALNQITGEIDWTFKAGVSGKKGIRSSPIIVGDAVCFGAYDGALYALEKHTGKLRWQFAEADWIGSSPCDASAMNSLYVGLEYAFGSQRGGLVSIDLRTGDRQWECPIPSLVHSSPLYVDQISAVMIGSNDGTMYCIDALSGQIRWSFKTEGAIKSRPAYDKATGIVLAGSFDKALYAWAADTGALVWKACTEGIVYSEPLVASDKVYLCSTDKHLYVLRVTDGSEESRFYAGSKLFSSPNLIGNRLYFGSTSGVVYEFDLLVQTISGKHFFDDKITNDIICDAERNRFYVSTISGAVIACERA